MQRIVPTILVCLCPAIVSAQRIVSTNAAAAGGPADASPASASIAAHASPTLATAIHAMQAPVIDGRDDDPVWAHAQLIDQFRQYDPVENGDPRFRNEAKVAYDERNLYVFVRAYDPHPDSIIARLGRRDNIDGSDALLVFIDGYHDRRTAFGFFVNPVGVKLDEYVYGDGTEDPSWDAVWDVATRIDSLGWTAEYRIPLSQIRFQRAATHTFGLAIARKIARFNQTDSWPLVRRSKGGLVSQFGDLAGVDGIASPHRLEVAPYTVTKTANAPIGDRYGQRTQGTVGADVKYGITSNLTLDATVNPDFGQVEADPSVLNLSGVETFFPEKRPFFLEGQNLFRFDVNCNDGVCSGLFYSRRIGRAPQLGDTYADSANPTATTIVGAAKVTGQLANHVSLGLLEASTAREPGAGGATIEPGTNYLVGTAGREFRGGASGISFMGTAVNRRLDAWTSPYLRSDAYAGGVQFRHQFLRNDYEVSGYYAQSLVSGSAPAIAATQTSMVHDYQSPDGHTVYDSLRTSLGGNSAQILFNKRGGDFTRFTVGYQYLSPGFEINDVGFLGRANSQNQFAWLQFQGNTPRAFYRNFRINFNQWANWMADGLRTDVGGNINAHVTLKNLWSLHAGQNVDGIDNSLCTICTRGGPALRQSRTLSGWFEVDGDDRRSLTPMVNGFWMHGDDGHSTTLEFDPMVQLRATSRFSSSVGLSFNRNINDAQWNGNYGDIGSDTTHYTVAHLDQKTLGVTTRVNFTATPTLSLQIYAQPFVTDGRFSDWREITDPRAAEYAARFRAYDGGDPGGFSFRQLRSNTVVRWEYRPGSVLFFVWAQQRTQSLSGADLAPFDARTDYRTLFGQHPGNVFLIKGSYWLNF